MSGFSGNTKDSTRNAAQLKLADSIGNQGTRPRSIDIAIRIEMLVFQRSREVVNDHYNTHIDKLVGILRAPEGFMTQQQLLAGATRPAKWVEDNVPKLKKPKKKKVEKKAPTAPTVQDAKKQGTPGAYYHFKSTPKEQAAAFKPKLLSEAQTTPRAILPAAKAPTQISAAPSAWNTGGTWEERNLTPFTHARIKESMAKEFMPFVSGALNVEAKEWKIDGDASLVLVRGKKRLGYELNISAEFKGTFQETKVEGKIRVPSVDLQESKDSDFEVQYDIKEPKLNTPHYGSVKAQLKVSTERIKSIMSQIAEDVQAHANTM